MRWPEADRKCFVGITPQPGVLAGLASDSPSRDEELLVVLSAEIVP